MDNDRYYVDLAAAFVRGRLPQLGGLEGDALVEAGRAAGLRLHKFKRNAVLPRVRKVLGALHAMAPETLLDVGSGRGTFLWPLLAEHPAVRVTAVDLDGRRTRDIGAVRAGGLERLSAARMDATRLAFADASFDVATLLEVVEHLDEPARAVGEAVRVARRFVVVSVPSKEDDNPQHVRLFDRQSLAGLLDAAGARRVTVEGVLNHYIAVASL